MVISMGLISSVIPMILLVLGLVMLTIGLVRSKLKFTLDLAARVAIALAVMAASFKYVM